MMGREKSSESGFEKGSAYLFVGSLGVIHFKQFHPYMDYKPEGETRRSCTI